MIEKANSTFRYGLINALHSEKAKKYSLEMCSLRSIFSCMNYYYTLKPKEIHYSVLEPYQVVSYFTKQGSKFKVLENLGRKIKELTQRGYRNALIQRNKMLIF